MYENIEVSDLKQLEDDLDTIIKEQSLKPNEDLKKLPIVKLNIVKNLMKGTLVGTGLQMKTLPITPYGGGCMCQGYMNTPTSLIGSMYKHPILMRR